MKNTNKNTKDLLIHIYDKMYKQFGPLKWWPGNSPFEIMVGAILTQNTSWTNVEHAINNLKSEELLEPYKLFYLENSKLSELIRPSGFYNVKTRRLKNFIYFFINEYEADIEKMKEEDLWDLRGKLLSLEGIGKETADSILLYALNMPVFVIDAYTKRIFSRHNIVSSDIDYGEFQDIFMTNLPQDADFYNEYHAQIVYTGKNFCKKKPLCSGCPLEDLKNESSL